MKNHGKLNEEGNIRFCDEHVEHGILYNCEYYPIEVQLEILSLSIKFEEQCKNGTIKITREFCGINGN